MITECDGVLPSAWFLSDLTRIRRSASQPIDRGKNRHYRQSHVTIHVTAPCHPAGRPLKDSMYVSPI